MDDEGARMRCRRCDHEHKQDEKKKATGDQCLALGARDMQTIVMIIYSYNANKKGRISLVFLDVATAMLWLSILPGSTKHHKACGSF